MPLSQRRTKLLRRLAVNKTRARERRVLVEGVRAVTEALDAGALVDFAIVSPRLDSTEEGRRLRSRVCGEHGHRAARDGPTDDDQPSGRAGRPRVSLPGGEEIECFPVSDAQMAAVADTEHPQGVLIVCEESSVSLRSWLDARHGGEAGVDPSGPRILVLDRVQDPGNVGTLIRSAVAFGLDLVLVLDGTTDPWGSKAVRASAGTVFRIPVARAAGAEAVDALSGAALPILVASAEGSAAVGPPENGFAIVLGNEGAGVREEVRRAATATVAVPMHGPAESLNVAIAGSILMSDFTRARG